MSAPAPELLHVLGVAAPGDPTTAAARALRDRLAAEGRPGRLAALQVHGSDDDVRTLRRADLLGVPVVVHAVDGGEALTPVLGELRHADVHLVHHGSRPGTDRSALRALRGATATVAAGDPSAREELRRLGFGEPAALPASVVAGALTATAAGAADDADPHPGPHLVAIGPITEARSLELLVDAFAHLLSSGSPSAVLSICGPADAWYLERLMRLVLRRGLVACEVIEPEDEAAVLRRLERSDVFVSLRPTALDPYLWHAAARARVVAPRVGATAPFAASDALVGLGVLPTRDELVRALQRAISLGTPSGGDRPPAGDARVGDLLRVA